MGQPQISYQVTADVLTGMVALVTAIWVLFRYNKSRRLEAAQWLHDLYSEFYLSDRFKFIKNIIEYEYDSKLAHLIERRMNDRQVPINSDQLKIMDELDTFLNYLEHLLGLESIGLITKKEREIIFDYWPRMFNYDGHAALRLYIAICGYEQLDKELSLSMNENMVFYGSLRESILDPRAPSKEGLLHYIGPCKIRGILVDQGSYPGILIDKSSNNILHLKRRYPISDYVEDKLVVGDVYRIISPRAFKIFDEWEEYDPENMHSSPYVRRLIRLSDPAIDAWIYEAQFVDDEYIRVDSGDWRTHCLSKGLEYTLDGPQITPRGTA